jgi:exodeoxyribonuclease VII large subunit
MRAGMKVLLCVHANFHETFGFSWIVDDIDPTFTLGDMAQRRKEIIRILTEQGVIDLNKQLTVSPFCKRIAVISSATAAGYGDFSNQLNDNTYGFKFETQLFPAIMQGENVENSIIQALSKIYTCNNFDCVVIIRGGGSTSDLSGFDTLPLAENVANFPLPVITGIGHDRDKSILDIVACVSLKTPTAVAEYLISNLATTLERITTCEQQLKSVFDIRKLREETYLNNLFLKLYNITEKKLLIDNNKIKIFEQRLIALDPVNILKKGFSITLKDGIAVKDASTLSEGDKLTLMFAHGTTEAVVKH